MWIYLGQEMEKSQSVSAKCLCIDPANLSSTRHNFIENYLGESYLGKENEKTQSVSAAHLVQCTPGPLDPAQVHGRLWWHSSLPRLVPFD